MPPLRDCAARAAARAARAAFPGRAPQRGSAHLQVARVGRRTEIVRLSHCAPVRLLPMATAAAERSGTAWCALGSFGGGFLGGDEVHVAIEVGPGSSLALTTQASTKVYQAKEDGQAAVQRLDATIAPAGLLVMAPDPLVPFAHSSYSQALRFALHANSDGECTSSAVVVDWLGSGRVATGEHWAFREYKSCLEFAWLQEDPMPGEPPVPGAPAAPGLIDSIFLTSEDALANSSPSIAGFDAAVSIFAVGPQAAPVAARLEAMASLLAARSGARVAEAARGTEGRCPVELSGRALMGLTPSSAPARSGCTVARLVAEKTEDVYRILHHCLSPLAEEIGVEPYADRVHGLSMTPTERSPLRSLESPRPSGRSQAMEAMEAPTKRVVAGVEGTKFDLQQSLILCQLTDATLPVGGFAHSNGIEAAHQLGLLRSGDLESLRSLVFQGALSMLRLQGYFVKEAHQLGAQKTLDAWQELDVKLNAYLASNGVASRASWLQGAGLLRVGKQWQPSVAWPRKGHYATSFGLLSRRLDLDLTLGLHAFAYAAVRDSMSAAVRLNLLGPLQAVELQASILQDLPIELGEGQTSPHGSHVLPASCAPVLECVHSGHDLLEARLFLT